MGDSKGSFARQGPVEEGEGGCGRLSMQHVEEVRGGNLWRRLVETVKWTRQAEGFF